MTTLAKQQNEACTTTVWTTTWPAPNHDTYSTYQTLVPCEGGLPAMLRPRELTTPLSQPTRHRNQARDSTPDGGTLIGIFVAIAGLLVLGVTMCIILKRKPNEGRNRHHAGGTRTARVRNGERQSHRDRGGRQHGGRRRSAPREASVGVFVDRSAQISRPPATQSQSQERHGTRTGAAKNQKRERTHSGYREPGTWGTRSASKNHTQINRDRLRLAMSDQASAAKSSTFPIHAAQDSTEDAESTAHERAVEDGQDGKTLSTPEEANEEGSDEEQADGTTHRQGEGETS